jgi:hypothetical protein
VATSLTGSVSFVTPTAKSLTPQSLLRQPLFVRLL